MAILLGLFVGINLLEESKPKRVNGQRLFWGDVIFGNRLLSLIFRYY
jgi:hypothetical protein